MLPDKITAGLRKLVINAHRFKEGTNKLVVKAALEVLLPELSAKTIAKLGGRDYILQPAVSLKMDEARRVLDESCIFKGVGPIMDKIYYAVCDGVGKENIHHLHISPEARVLLELIIEEIEIYEATSESDLPNHDLDERALEVHKNIINLALKLDPETLKLKEAKLAS